MKFFLIKYFKLFEKEVTSLTYKQLGELGEYRVVQFLKGQGYRILNKNWKHKKHEIDIIAKDGKNLVFIEVKSGIKENIVPLYYRVGSSQKNSISQAAKVYMQKCRYRPEHFRFDIVEVYFSSEGKSNIRHHPNILLFSKYFQ